MGFADDAPGRASGAATDSRRGSGCTACATVAAEAEVGAWRAVPDADALVPTQAALAPAAASRLGATDATGATAAKAKIGAGGAVPNADALVSTQEALPLPAAARIAATDSAGAAMATGTGARSAGASSGVPRTLVCSEGSPAARHPRTEAESKKQVTNRRGLHRHDS